LENISASIVVGFSNYIVSEHKKKRLVKELTRKMKLKQKSKPWNIEHGDDIKQY